MEYVFLTIVALIAAFVFAKISDNKFAKKLQKMDEDFREAKKPLKDKLDKEF